MSFSPDNEVKRYDVQKSLSHILSPVSVMAATVLESDSCLALISP